MKIILCGFDTIWRRNDHVCLIGAKRRLPLISRHIPINNGVCLNRDGFGTFTINLPHQGAVTLLKSLDYEKGGGVQAARGPDI
jgi:hypothetical protein